jgi:hypothetical protein
MRHHCRLASSICGVPSGPAQLSCRSHGMATRGSGLRHPDLAARPCPNLLDRLAGARVRGLNRLEHVQNVLRARGSPQSQEPMVGVRKRPPRRMVMKRGSRSLGRIMGRTITRGPPGLWDSPVSERGTTPGHHTWFRILSEMVFSLRGLSGVWCSGRGRLAQGIPQAAMSPAASGGRTVEPVTEEDF